MQNSFFCMCAQINELSDDKELTYYQVPLKPEAEHDRVFVNLVVF